LLRRGLSVVERGVWAHVGTASGEFGWKLHLSATQATAFELLDQVVPILVHHALAFKVIRDGELLAMLNEGALGPTQVGKFMTIYLAQDRPQQIDEVTRELIAVTQEIRGPKIQTDLALGGAVYARYGAFSPAMKRDRLGFYQPADDDQKGDYTVPFVPPEGIPNPFQAYVKPRSHGPQTPKTGPIGPGYLLTGVVQMHPKGAVLSALDVRRQETVRRVILKEGRPNSLSDEHGRDMWFRLRNQARAHADLAHTGVVPEAGELFEHGGNLYLPVEYVEGRAAWCSSISRSATGSTGRILLRSRKARPASSPRSRSPGKSRASRTTSSRSAHL
jgi:hypothetical protein